MVATNNGSKARILWFCCLFSFFYTLHAEQPTNADNQPLTKEDTSKKRRINKIIISGNQFTSPEAILSYIPYKIGELFQPYKSRQLINNLYFGLKRFSSIKVKSELIGSDALNLHIIVEEKPPLKDIIIKGNSALSEKEIKKKVNFDVPAVDKEELVTFIEQIKKLYLERGYHQVIIDADLAIDPIDQRAIATFTITEGKKSLIKRIRFIGNNRITDKELRKILFSREDWLFGFLDKSSTYNPDRIEADKHMIEQWYQNNGFLQAKVFNTTMIPDDNDSTSLTLTFEIEEGDLYRIKDIQAPGNEVVPEEILLAFIPIRPGEIYSRERVANTIKLLERIWGDHGYIFAHVEPSIQPDQDTKTVSLSFLSDLGNKVYLNQIAIKGNKKTRDKIIRRKILLEEGELLTQSMMDISKGNVESLGYFEPRDGVNWKIRRLNQDHADLDLMVKETKTGHLNFQLGYGGAGLELKDPAAGITVKGQISDTNLFGSGIYWNVEGSWAKDEQTLIFHLAQPWLFDKPITGAIDLYHKRPTFDRFTNININAVNEKLTGGSGTLGFITRSRTFFFNDMSILGTIGYDSIKYQQLPQARFLPELARVGFQRILDKEFSPGDFVWLAGSLEQDMRNHPIHTSRGYRWRLTSKIALPVAGQSISFFRTTAEVYWFTPLIGEQDLILRLHGFAGIVTPIANRNIPYNELFNVGGDNSVRGYVWGQISPKFAGDPIGAKKAFWVNAELMFPITPDLNMKGVAFYDGGVGWDNPYVRTADCPFVTSNGFDYRHAVGVGIRILNPMPLKVDWGFKIDPRKDRLDPSKNESPYEIHFGMTYDW